jgi:hypothetical protein
MLKMMLLNAVSCHVLVLLIVSNLVMEVDNNVDKVMLIKIFHNELAIKRKITSWRYEEAQIEIILTDYINSQKDTGVTCWILSLRMIPKTNVSFL